MILHVLPGDAYLQTFRETNLEGDVAVCRECLMEGEINADSLQEFWEARERYLEGVYPDTENNYSSDVVAEFEKIIRLPENSEIDLWFEYELFCQVNMWFCLDLLRNSNADIYRIEPSVRQPGDIWKGFGRMSADDLESCFAARKRFSPEDVRLGSDLWDAYRTDNHAQLKILSGSISICFPYLKEVCEAALEKDIRPKEILKEIMGTGEKDFNKIFSQFSERAAIYGFGDAQVKRELQSY